MKRFLVPVVLQVEAMTPDKARFIAQLVINDGVFSNLTLNVRRHSIGTPEELFTMLEVRDEA